MATIEYITVDVADPAAADRFYSTAFDLGSRVRARASDDRADGFSGFTLSLVVAQPADARSLIDAAVEVGGTTLKPAARSLWGYGGVVQAPDGTIVTIASSSKKDSGPATRRIDEIVLQLGVADVAASRAFYLERGVGVAKSYGRRYVELDTGPITVTLNKRAALAKTAGVSPEGKGPNPIRIASDVGEFTDPDGFRWEAGSR